MKQTHLKWSTAGLKIFTQKTGAHLQTYTDTEDAKGRITTRTLTASALLTEHTDWPGLQQVYQYTTHQKCKKTAQVKCHVQYGITSLTPERASAADLLKLRREHSTIENKLHWIRDTVFQEDASNVRTGVMPQVHGSSAKHSNLCFTMHRTYKNH